MIKLLSPVDKVDEVEGLIEAGADELYCGLLTAEWHDKYIGGAISRRPGGGANFTTFEDLQKCLDIARSRRVPVFLTLNEHYYMYKQYPYILDYVSRVEKMGVYGMMVADLALLLTLKEVGTGIRIVISTGGTTFNSETIRFYQELGASRVIIPRHLTIQEIGEMAESVSGIELETFIFNSRCPNIDGFCTFQHGLADHARHAAGRRPHRKLPEVRGCERRCRGSGRVPQGRGQVDSRQHRVPGLRRSRSAVPGVPRERASL